MNRRLFSLSAIALFGSSVGPACTTGHILAGLDNGDAGTKTDADARSDANGGNPPTKPDANETADDAGGNAPDSSFVCTPPANATQAPITFTGAVYDDANGCLEGDPVTLPICGCFTAVGADSATWCFVAPDGTTYFGASPDGCTVQIPEGWYAVQTSNTFPTTETGTPTQVQGDVCRRLGQASIGRGSYDLPGPPKCGADGKPRPCTSGTDCPFFKSCEGGVCTLPAADAGEITDGGRGKCVDVDAAAYDTSCKTDDDCIVATVGTVCTCAQIPSVPASLCPSECQGSDFAINQDGFARNDAAIAPVVAYSPCLHQGSAHVAVCLHGQCALKE